MTPKEKRISRLLSLVLRHDPASIGLTLDSQGWAKVDDLLDCLAKHKKETSLESLQTIVAENNKSRFAFSEDETKIRASQGHSINIDLQLTPQSPPEFLYHGTCTRFMEAIEKEGLMKMSRQHVHLSADISTAHTVGKRHGNPIILEVAASLMESHHFKFYLSENQVWLTDHVPPDYLTRRFSSHT